MYILLSISMQKSISLPRKREREKKKYMQVCVTSGIHIALKVNQVQQLGSVLTDQEKKSKQIRSSVQK